MFCGPRGVGKTTCARILAKTINCTNLKENIEPCNECESCISFNDGRSYNIHELDGASNNSVDDMRSLTEKVRIPPQVGTKSVYIVDEVHMLSASAFNAFLKTLEEPPSHAIFILATTEKHKIIPTILSRCQIFDFNRIKISDIVGYLTKIAENEGVQAEDDALNMIAQKADGGMRDALSIYDQMVSFCGNEVNYSSVVENLNILDYEYYFRFIDYFNKNSIHKSLLLYDEILAKGFDGRNFLGGLASHCRDLLVCKNPDSVKLLEVGESIKEKYLNQSSECEISILYKFLEVLQSSESQYNYSRDKRLHVEWALIQLCAVKGKKKSEDLNEDEDLKNDDKPKEKERKELVKDNAALSERVRLKAKDRGPRQQSEGPLPSVSIRNKPNQAEDITKEKEEEAERVETENEAVENNSLNEEEVKEQWLIIIDEYREIQPRLYALLSSETPFKETESTLKFYVSNKNQFDYLLKLKGKIQEKLRSSLKNSAVSLEIDINEELAPKIETKKTLTNDDKYKILSEKNPDIQKLRNDFLLDFD